MGKGKLGSSCRNGEIVGLKGNSGGRGRAKSCKPGKVLAGKDLKCPPIPPPGTPSPIPGAPMPQFPRKTASPAAQFPKKAAFPGAQYPRKAASPDV